MNNFATQSNQKHFKFVLMIFTLIGTLILLGTSNLFFSLIALSLATIFILFIASNNYILYLLLFLLPLSPIFNLGANGNTLFTFLIVIAIGKLILKNKNLEFSYKEIITFAAFFSFSLLFGGIEAIAPLTKIFLYFLLMLLLFKSNETFNLRGILVFFSYGIIFASFAGSLSEFIPGLAQHLNEVSLRLDPGEYINRFSGLQVNPNFYTMDISIALAGWFGLIITKKIKLIDYFFVIVLSIFGIMSLSISFLITLFILIAIMMMSFLKENLKNFLKGLFIITLFSLGIFIFIDNEYIYALMDRIMMNNNFDSGVSSVTTGRSDRWFVYLEHIFNNVDTLIVGEGINADYIVNMAPHNYYIETMYYLGLVGSILYIFCIVVVFPKRNIFFNKNLLNYLPLFILLIRGLGISLIMRESLIFYLIIAAVMLNTNLKKKSIE